tara:strand:+ start:582 stop:2849 length:2268 start_codon:yes stop_codon:yes gene_type:complete
MPFTADADYDAISTKLHKPHPGSAGTPSVVRHLGFWIPSDAQGALGNVDAARERWLLSADAFLVGIYVRAHELWREQVKADEVRQSEHGVGRSAVSARHEPKILTASRPTALLFASEFTPFKNHQPPGDLPAGTRLQLRASAGKERRYESITLKFFCGGVPVKIRATLYQEYFTLTLIAQFGHGDPTQDLASKVKTVIEELEGGLTDRWAKIMTHLDGCAPEGEREGESGHGYKSDEEFTADIRRMHPAANFLYKEIWDYIDQEIFDPVLNSGLKFSVSCSPDAVLSPAVVKLGETPQILQKSDIGGVFCDLRSCLFSVGVDDRYSVENDCIPPPTESSRLTRIQSFSQNNLFTNRPRQDLAGYTSPHVFTARDSINVVDTFFPFLEASTLTTEEVADLPAQPSQATVLQRREYTASLLLDRRAIHLSSLSGDSEIGHPKPSKYLLVFRHRHRWQIGRLIERMNRLGTLRLASLKRWNRLRDVDHNLQRLDSRVKPARDLRQVESGAVELLLSIKAYEEVFSSATRPGEKPTDGDTRGDIKPGATGHTTSHSWSGSDESLVMHWIARSIHYIREFELTVSDLRDSRIEGFQPYPEFVRRRIAGTWASVEGLAARIERMQGHRRYFMTSQLIQSIAKAEKRNEGISRETLNLQKMAELAAPVAVAYYGGHLLSDLGETDWVHHHFNLGALVQRITPFDVPVPTTEHEALVVNAIIAVLLYYSAQLPIVRRAFGFMVSTVRSSAKTLGGERKSGKDG